jgi:hypothetical protein
MSQKVFLVHGWSVTETTTYQALHLKLAENGFELKNVFLGRYVTLEDKVEIRDIARALHKALVDEMGENWNENFHIITHSTGALVVKQWIVHHYKEKFTQNKPLKNIVFLAGPHFGSRLAHHGKSMLAQIKYLGDTGEKVLTALELGSEHSWEINEAFLDRSNWKDKGVRPFCIIGDRVKKEFFASKIFPGAFEEGSDMVVRVPAGNLNFKRFLLSQSNIAKLVGEINEVPFVALQDFTHSGPDYGIMNSIKKSSGPQSHLSLRLILDCLKVQSEQDYAAVNQSFKKILKETRKKRQGFAQLDFRFRDEDGNPIDDYLFKLGVIVDGKEKPSKTVEDTHKNNVDPNHFTAFINMKELEPKLTYYFDFNAVSGSRLFEYKPESLRVQAVGNILNYVCENQATQFDIILSREPEKNLFVFHPGDDNSLHVEWDRAGNIKKTNLPIK